MSAFSLLSLACADDAFSQSVVPKAVPESAASAAQIQAIDAMMSRLLKPEAPGATVLVTENGKQLIRKAYGLADVAHGVPLQPQMALRVGSVTKQFTAAAVLLLVEDGKLAVTDDIAKILPAWPATNPLVTIDNLLAHTSGIPNYTALPRFSAVMRTDTSISQAIAFFKNEPPEFGPGQRFSYSNSNYFLLGAIIEAASGTTYPDFMQGRIFQPLGMTHTRIETDMATPPSPAIGYTRGRKGVEPVADYSMSWPFAAGALRTSVDDLAIWHQAMVSGTLLKPEAWKRMMTSRVLANGKPTGYGYGLFIRKRRGQIAIEHGGDIGGFSADTLYLPADNIYITVLANNDSLDTPPDELVEKIAALCTGRNRSAWW
ncbi:serine hydrolase domain-containing protein [Hydrogenophaga sp.]|uniref:serine hydrolase domain-containing protein n=1 Tax=Hydrogenophaga sp. TaxID=1904254 RepID=UPI003F718B86